MESNDKQQLDSSKIKSKQSI